ncbi:MAG TPA: phosphatidate cytidylyltransferase [Alphaproteobacteria bacterium]|nr:phosphatidate cytidylyltransferase [Alphaproteobacteria bacterium]
MRYHRLISALVLLPLVLIPMIFGHPWFDIFLIIMGFLAISEWFLICQKSCPVNPKIASQIRFILAAIVLMFLIIMTILASTSGGINITTFSAITFGLLAILFLVAWRLKICALFLSWLGVIYIAMAIYAMLWLRYDGQFGVYNILWLFLVVWATDIFAMVVGKTVKGPRLAPRISPNKTWSGLVGGMTAASTVSFIFAYMQDSPYLLLCAIFGAVFAIVEQMGDLLESMLKRKFGVKDSSQLIPGHGGVLDRIDGLLLLSICMALIFYFFKIEWWKLA